jgi:hypothetical protein
MKPQALCSSTAIPAALQTLPRRPKPSPPHDPTPATTPTPNPQRTIMTANHLPYPKLRWKALDEIHAGAAGALFDDV